MMAFCPEHSKWDQNPKFTPLSETTSIPTPFTCGVPLPGSLLAAKDVSSERSQRFGPQNSTVMKRINVYMIKLVVMGFQMQNISSLSFSWSIIVQQQNSSVLKFWRQIADVSPTKEQEETVVFVVLSGTLNLIRVMSSCSFCCTFL